MPRKDKQKKDKKVGKTSFLNLNKFPWCKHCNSHVRIKCGNPDECENMLIAPNID